MWPIVIAAVVIGEIYLLTGGKKRKKCRGCGVENTKYKCGCGKKFCDSCTKTCTKCRNVVCTDCSSSCAECGDLFCKDCLKKVRHSDFPALNIQPIKGKYCAGCWDKVVKPVFAKYAMATHKAQNMECYPITYKGNLNLEPWPRKPISAGWFKDKQEAEYRLKVIAAFKGCDVVYSTNYEYQVREDDNYKYRVWLATGIAAKR